MTSSSTIQEPLQDQLRRLFSKAKLPSSPALASRILTLAENPDTPIEQFATVIQMDGALAARLLKMANAACMALRTPATTIQRAVSVLGLGRVRTAALGFQLVGHLNKLGGKNFDIKAYWQQSVLRGCVGREMAHVVVPALAEEAFLIGLLCDGGILLLVQLLGSEYATLYETGGLTPAAFYAAEKERFPYHHVDAIGAMAAEWNLPESIRKPLARHHRPTELKAGTDDVDRLCALAYLIGSLCFEEDLNGGQCRDDLLAYAEAQFGLRAEDVCNCLTAAGEAYKHSSELLGENLPDEVDVADLLGEANRQLMAAAGEAENKVLHAEAQRDQIKTALGEYRERAARDPLTGLFNRGALTEAATRHLADSRDRMEAITCLFLDVDNFKKLNDEYSHQTGDAVLKALAHAIQNAVVNAGSVGRYGGEEFVLVIPGLKPEEAAERAQQVVEWVRSIDYVNLGLKHAVTCSVGGVWAAPGRFENAESLFAAADEQMYIAKKSGKDRSSHQNLGSAKTADSIDVESVKSTQKQDGTAQQEARIPDIFRRIAENLNRRQPGLHTNDRMQDRTDTLSSCVIRVIAGPDWAIREEQGFVRDISTTGIGLLMLRPFARGEALEVMIRTPAKSLLYIAGTVASCRHVEGPVHELRVQLTAQAKEPIFSANPKAAVNQYGWLADALGSRK